MTTHFLAECLATPWALQPERMAAYAAVIVNRYISGSRPAGIDVSGMSSAKQPPPVISKQSGGISVIAISGAIIPHAGSLAEMCDGATSVERVVSALNDANKDPSVSSIIARFHTPGGSVYGMSQLASAIRESKKPVYGIADHLAASAGYWALSQCREAYVTPDGEVGSIGVYSGHENVAKAMEMAGVDIEFFSAGKYKLEGNPFGPMSEEGRQFQNQRAADYYGAFTRDVAKGRRVAVGQVRSGMGEGRVLGADAAKAAGMVDGVMTMDQLVRHIQRGAKPQGRSAQEQNSTRLAILNLG